MNMRDQVYGKMEECAADERKHTVKTAEEAVGYQRLE